MSKVVFISGAITDEPNYKNNFTCAERKLKREGYEVVNPTVIPIISKWDWSTYMDISCKLLEHSDAIYMLVGYHRSKGALLELKYAQAKGKEIMYER